MILLRKLVRFQIIKNMSLAKYFKNSSQSLLDKDKQHFVLRPKNEAEKLNDIPLNPGKTIVGRSPETGIRDVRCSKRQLEFDVDTEKAHVKVRILGANPCGINGAMALQNNEFELKNGDVVELVYGKHPYVVQFKNYQVKSKDGGGEQPSESDSWDSIENGKALIYASCDVIASDKIAAYDVDHTIIKTKSGNVFPKNIEDWELNFAEIPQKLKKLYESGFKICFFTNQGGIDKGKINVNDFKNKVQKIVKKLGVPIQVFVAISDGYYRKPLPGMWEYLRDNKNDNKQIDLNRSFYVGDAAGRPEIGKGANKRRKDHSLADRLFAANIGISFFTPEEHFLNHKTEAYTPPEFDPKTCNEAVSFKPENFKVPSGKCEMIIMVGLPGSGKSHFVHQHLAPLGYTILNADTLGSSKACLNDCERSLSNGQSCVVDNTNVDAESRQKFIQLAKKFNVPCRCFIMNVSLAQVRHNIAFRHLTDTNHSRINDMVFNMMKKKYKTPTTDEGIQDVVQVELSPNFENPKDEELYKMYLVDK